MSFETARDERKANREEMVRFHRDETELAGVLCLPEGAEPHPVMTFIHGSGPAGRNGYHGFPPLWQAFARRECASLSWDKPGVGESSGDWMVQTLQDRARECLAALTFLSQRSDIDARRMGVYGRSQAGWVIPHLVQMTDLVACIIAVFIRLSRDMPSLFTALLDPAQHKTCRTEREHTSLCRVCYPYGLVRLPLLISTKEYMMLLFILFSFFFFVLFANSRWLHHILYPDPVKRKRHDTEPHP